MSSSTTQQIKPQAQEVQTLENLLKKQRNNNKKIDQIKQVKEKFANSQDEPSEEQKTKIASLQSKLDEGKKIEKEIKDYHKGVKDAKAKEAAQARENDKLIEQGRREGAQAIANMIAIHTFQDCGHSDLVPDHLGEGINFFRDSINKLTLRTQAEPQSDWKENRDCFVDHWTKLGTSLFETVPNSSITYADLSNGIQESLESGNYPEHVAKQKKERVKKHKKAEAEAVQEEVVEAVAEVVTPEPEATVEQVEEVVEEKVEEAEAVEEQKETVEEKDSNAEVKRDNKRERGRGGNRGRGERGRGTYHNKPRYDNKDEDGFEMVKDEKVKDKRGGYRGRGRGNYNNDGGEPRQYRGGNRGNRGDRGGERGGERGDRGDRGGRARPTTSRKGKEFSEGKQVNEAGAGETTETPKE